MSSCEHQQPVDKLILLSQSGQLFSLTTALSYGDLYEIVSIYMTRSQRHEKGQTSRITLVISCIILYSLFYGYIYWTITPR